MINTKPIQRGSEWRKWDLHVHTPASYDWDSKCKKTNSNIVDTAKKLIAIYDQKTKTTLAKLWEE